VETDQQDVIGEKHEPGPFIGESVPSENLVSKITCLGATKSVFEAMDENKGSLQISLIWGFFMMNFHIVMEVIQKRIPAPTIVRMPGTHPRTLKIFLLVFYLS
jgi:hypothetical protein